MQFLGEGHVFEAQLHIHNLHTTEFGALPWCLTLGDLKPPIATT